MDEEKIYTNSFNLNKAGLDRVKTAADGDFGVNIEIEENFTIAEKAEIIKSPQERFFEISITNNKNKEYYANFKINIDAAENIERLIQGFSIYKAFLNRNIKINGIDLFGGILKGEIIKSENADYIDDVIKYWQKIKQLETVLNVNFKPQSSIPPQDSDLLEIFYKSFVDGKGVLLNEINSLDMTLSNLDSLDGQIGSTGEISTIFNNGAVQVLGVEIKGLYHIIYMSNVTLEGYDILDESAKKVRLKIEKGNEDTVYIMKYFRSEEEARNYISYCAENIEELKQLKPLWG